MRGRQSLDSREVRVTFNFGTQEDAGTREQLPLEVFDISLRPYTDVVVAAQ